MTGPQGAQGIQGEQGPIGPTGLTGPQGVQGPPGNDGADGLNGTDGADGQDGVGIASTVDNNNGTFTINFTDGSSFTTADLTGPQGAQGIQGEQGPIGPTGLTGPQGVQGPPGNNGIDGLNGQDGVGIVSTVDNNDGTFTLNYSDGSSFTTPDLTGPQGSGFNDGSITNQILYWSGNSWVTLDPGSNGQVLTICNGNLTWTIDGQCPPGSIASLDCDNTIVNGTITENTSANNVSVTISYTNGDGGYYDSQTLNSSGVSGLIATIDSGNFNSGDGNLSFNITGTPTSSGTAGFNINIGGQTCLLNINVEGLDLASLYPPGSIFCDSGPTEIVDVVNPVTGKVWMDRNLGASRAATSSTDALAYGDLYQWGRGNDGHQCRNSDTTSTLSNSDQPSHGNFIYNPNPDYNWRSPQNYTLWQGVNGVNNPCPSGYRLPTKIELDNERLSWIDNGSAGAFNSPLKLPMAGKRHYSNGLITYVSSHGEYWTSKTSGQYSYMLGFGDTSWSGMYSSNRAFGYSIRCIKN
ncbi:hypothetical protein [Gaetbulibacter jejuensis]|uniref:hypothetical protein n=1 Tax=Gaetbulibacter jejuensis TaxID=584607 RepID=UPI0030080A40